MKRRHITGLVWGAVAAGLVLIIKSEALPFNGYLYDIPVFTAVFGILNFPAFIVLMMTRIDYKPFFLLLVFVQWFFIGVFVSWFLQKLKA